MKLDKTKGTMGLRIAIAERRQNAKLMRPHSKRIIRARGTSLKSAPFMPIESDTAPSETTKKKASRIATETARIDGWKISDPIVAVTVKIIKDMRTTVKYLLFAKFRAEIGAA